MRNKKIICLFLNLTFMLGLSLKSFADSMAVPAKLQAALFLKILSYDRKIKGDIKIGILSGSGKGDIEQSFQSLQGQKINGNSFSLTDISLGELSSMKSKGIDVLYVTPDNKGNLSSITRASRSNGVLTITGVPDYVEDGISVGIGLKSGKPDIMVNLSASKDEDRDLSSQLLKLCTVIK